MKNSIMIIALLLVGSVAMAQTPDTTTYEYCEVVSITKNLSPVSKIGAVNVFIDFGRGFVFSSDNPLKDENAVDLEFISQIDCLNYLSKKGWKVGQTAMFLQQGGSLILRSVTRYTLSRPKYVVRNQ